MADKILVNGVQFHGYHGVSPEEREVGGRYVVDVELSTDLRRAGKTDDLADTVSYTEVAAVVSKIGRERSFRLVEGLASQLAEQLLAQFPMVDEVLVRVKKQPPPLEEMLDFSGVEIRRGR